MNREGERIQKSDFVYFFIVFIFILSIIVLNNFSSFQKNFGEVKKQQNELENILPPQKPEPTYSPNQTICTNGEKRECINEDGCNGKQICIEGSWTKCYIERACEPNKRVICNLDGCSFGYRTCNRCGDSWSECEPG